MGFIIIRSRCEQIQLCISMNQTQAFFGNVLGMIFFSLFPNSRNIVVYSRCNLKTFDFMLIWDHPEVWEWEQRSLFEIRGSNGGQANKGSKHVFLGTEREPLPLISIFLWAGWQTAACCFGSVFTLPLGRNFYILHCARLSSIWLSRKITLTLKLSGMDPSIFIFNQQLTSKSMNLH